MPKWTFRYRVKKIGDKCVKWSAHLYIGSNDNREERQYWYSLYQRLLRDTIRYCNNVPRTWKERTTILNNLHERFSGLARRIPLELC